MKPALVAVALAAATTACIATAPLEPIPSGPNLHPGARDVPALRVLVSRDPSLPPPRVWSGGAYVLRSRRGQTAWRVALRGRQLDGESVEHIPGGFRVGSREIPGDALAIESTGVGRIRLDDRSPGGQALIFEDSPKGLRIVQRVDLETYTAGVVAGEMPSTFAPEALRAQAIVARSYAMERLRHRKADAFDVRDDTGDQVYHGEVPSFSPPALAARATRGWLLTVRGQPFAPYYHSTCGGVTASLEAAFGDPSQDRVSAEAHRAVPCGRCAASPAYRWKTRISASDVRRALQALHVPGERLRSIEATRRDESGRWIRVRLRTGAAAVEVPGPRLRMALGPTRLKSTWITEARLERDGSLRVKGRGFGHGAGMCQWGAQGFALEGADHRAILRHYYPSARLERAYR